MEPVTHFLTGACLGRAGFNRKTAYATLAAVLAAEAADLDVLWWLAGPVEELKRHRGITHTFVAVPVVAGVVVVAVWVLDWWLRRRKAGPSTPSAALRSLRMTNESEQRVHWGWLYLTAVVAALSHLLLDWTNNYGVRPFFPFNPRWYAGSFVFIAEPVLWGLLFLALVMPWLLGLADREIGARKKPFRGQGWAIFALVGMVSLWCWRWGEHAQGLAMIANTQVAREPVTRVALEPYPVDPYRWHAIVETQDFYQTAEVNTWTESIDSDAERDVIYKPADTPAVEAAKQTPLGRAYLDWGRWAVVRDVGPEPVAGMSPPDLSPLRHWTTVEFTDLRFNYKFLPTQEQAGRAPLSGWVYIVDGSDDAGEMMGEREQH
ncbi:MAG: metal-dependent hydrolase [Terracidiphilus sp.]|jgi:inner membrane protein